MKNSKALLLVPAASAGVLTALAFNYPPSAAAELALMLAIVAPFYLASVIILVWMWRKPPRVRFLGLSRGTWSILIAIAYALGMCLMVVFRAFLN